MQRRNEKTINKRSNDQQESNLRLFTCHFCSTQWNAFVRFMLLLLHLPLVRLSSVILLYVAISFFTCEKFITSIAKFHFATWLSTIPIQMNENETETHFSLTQNKNNIEIRWGNERNNKMTLNESHYHFKMRQNCVVRLDKRPKTTLSSFFLSPFLHFTFYFILVVDFLLFCLRVAIQSKWVTSHHSLYTRKAKRVNEENIDRIVSKNVIVLCVCRSFKSWHFIISHRKVSHSGNGCVSLSLPMILLMYLLRIWTMIII